MWKGAADGAGLPEEQAWSQMLACGMSTKESSGDQDQRKREREKYAKLSVEAFQLECPFRLPWFEVRG